ncbi:MAG: DUF5337 family protein [Albidovulum sp.]|nr:DUF5337 family protein [Albidovulum sp.]
MSGRRKGEPSSRKGTTLGGEFQKNRKNARILVGAVVVIATMILWMALSLGGGLFGLPIRYAFLLDFAALAAFAWAIIVMWPSLRERLSGGGD